MKARDLGCKHLKEDIKRVLKKLQTSQNKTPVEEVAVKKGKIQKKMNGLDLRCMCTVLSGPHKEQRLTQPKSSADCTRWTVRQYRVEPFGQ